MRTHEKIGTTKRRWWSKRLSMTLLAGGMTISTGLSLPAVGQQTDTKSDPRSRAEQAQQQQRAQDDARKRAEEQARQRAEQQARDRAQQQQQQRAQEQARQRAEQQARERAQQQQQQRAQEQARQRAEQQARERAQQQQQQRAQEQARQRAEQQARERAQQQQQQRAQEQAKQQAEQQARQRAEQQARDRAQQQQQQRAQEQAKQQAEQQARQRAEQQARDRAQQQQQQRAQEQARQQAEQQARQRAEQQARDRAQQQQQQRAQEQARQQAEQQARQRAEQQARERAQQQQQRGTDTTRSRTEDLRREQEARQAQDARTRAAEEARRAVEQRERDLRERNNTTNNADNADRSNATPPERGSIRVTPRPPVVTPPPRTADARSTAETTPRRPSGAGESSGAAELQRTREAVERQAQTDRLRAREQINAGQTMPTPVPAPAPGLRLPVNTPTPGAANTRESSPTARPALPRGNPNTAPLSAPAPEQQPLTGTRRLLADRIGEEAARAGVVREPKLPVQTTPTNRNDRDRDRNRDRDHRGGDTTIVHIDNSVHYHYDYRRHRDHHHYRDYHFYDHGGYKRSSSPWFSFNIFFGNRWRVSYDPWYDWYCRPGFNYSFYYDYRAPVYYRPWYTDVRYVTHYQTVYQTEVRYVDVPVFTPSAPPVHVGPVFTLDQAWRLVSEGFYSEARTAFSRLALDRPFDMELRIGYAIASGLEGDDGAAIFAMRRALAEQPEAILRVPMDGRLTRGVRDLIGRYAADSRRNEFDRDAYFMIAALNAAIGEDGLAFFAIDRAIELGDTDLATLNLDAVIRGALRQRLDGGGR